MTTAANRANIQKVAGAQEVVDAAPAITTLPVNQVDAARQLRDVLTDATCSLFVEAAYAGTAPTPERAYQVVAHEWGAAWADHLLEAGWLLEIVDTVEQLESGDLDVAATVVDLRYCS